MMRSISAFWLNILFSSYVISSDNQCATDAVTQVNYARSKTPSIDGDTNLVGTTTFENDNTSAWDKHIRYLEHLLEADLEKIGKDAASTLSISTEEDRNATLTLTNDLMHVREDIERLVQSVKNVESELGFTKKKIDEEEKYLRERAAQVETEKFIEVLHRGKAKVKVDYVTGQIVRKPNAKKKKVTNGDGLKKDKSKTDTSNIAISKASEFIRNVTLSKAYDKSAQGSQRRRTRKESDEVEDEMNEVEIATAAGSDGDDEFIGVRQHIENHPDMRNRIREEMEYIKLGSDPAVIKFDSHLMLDIVKLAITASLFGLLAVFFKLPPTAGFVVGGMLIGPSCLDVLGEIHQVRTLAQFGIIFLLFEQGLLYSKTYFNDTYADDSKDEISSRDLCHDSDDRRMEISQKEAGSGFRVNSEKALHSRKNSIQPTVVENFLSRSNNQSPLGHGTSKLRSSSFIDDEDHDPNVVGFVILMLLIFVALVVVILTNVASSATEGIMLSSTIAICSTTIISETMDAAKISNTHWGVGVLKMMSIHDLFMVPLLALPQLLSSLNESLSGEDEEAFDTLPFRSVRDVVLKLGLVAVFLKISSFLATNIIRAASYADKRIPSTKGELFTLSVVAYALLIATASEELSMSIEAGAVLAGIALFRSPHVPKVITSIQPITRVFGGMYFTSLGMIISPLFVLEEAGSIFELVCLIGLFKLVLVSTVLNRFFDYRITQSVAVGSAMAQISEFSLLVLAKSKDLGLIRRKTYLLFIPTVCILLILAPFSAGLLRRLPKMQDSGVHDLGDSILKFVPFLQNPLRKKGCSNSSSNNNNQRNHEMLKSKMVENIPL